jgi:hypothetical protein
MGTASKLSFTGLLAWLVGCGPSLVTVHEGTIRFEHCYRVDLEPHVRTPNRVACWRSWITAYTVGQPRDRIEYAQRRLHALESGDTSPPALALGADRAPEARQFYLVVPQPTSVHAPPPPVAKPVQDAESDVTSDAGAPNERQAKTGDGKAVDPDAPPGSSCTKRCQAGWRSCDESCEATGASGCPKCKSAYSKCMRSCFD